MSYSKDQLEAQRAQLATLHDEMSRLDAQFAAHLHTLGLRPEDFVQQISGDPALATKLSEAQDKAQRAGAARAAQCHAASDTAVASGTHLRKGAIRL